MEKTKCALPPVVPGLNGIQSVTQYTHSKKKNILPLCLLSDLVTMKFLWTHITSLLGSGQLRELSLKYFRFS